MTEHQTTTISTINDLEDFIYTPVYLFGFQRRFQHVEKVISRQVVLWAEESSTYSWSRFPTVNC